MRRTSKKRKIVSGMQTRSSTTNKGKQIQLQTENSNISETVTTTTATAFSSSSSPSPPPTTMETNFRVTTSSSNDGLTPSRVLTRGQSGDESFVSRSSYTTTETNSFADQLQKSRQPTSANDIERNLLEEWIRDNYEPKKDANVPRQGLFEHYKYYCATNGITPINSATLGKVIRAVYPGVATRRLGNRGQSKYQYSNLQRRGMNLETTHNTTTTDTDNNNNINNNNDSHHQVNSNNSNNISSNVRNDANSLPATSSFYSINDNLAITSPSTSALRMDSLRSANTDSTSLITPNSSSTPSSSLQILPPFRLPDPSNHSLPSIQFADFSSAPSLPPFSSSTSLKTSHSLNNDLNTSHTNPTIYQLNQNTLPPPPPPQQQQQQQPSPVAYTTLPQDHFITLPSLTYPMFCLKTNSTTLSSIISQFSMKYEHHCRSLFHYICTGKFEELRTAYEQFYYRLPNDMKNMLHEVPEMTDSIWKWDCILYDTLIIQLLPNINTPTSDTMMSNLRQFTKDLPNFLQDLLKDYPNALRLRKIDVASIFVAKLRRHLTLNQYALTVTDIIRQPHLLRAMREIWMELDFGIILDHALWICDCKNNDMKTILENEILYLLSHGTTLEQWMEWEGKVIDKYLGPTPKQPNLQEIDKYIAASKQFILKWNMYSGLITQQLAMKKVSHLDSFKAFQFFFSDLILYHVEERIAGINAKLSQPLPTRDTSSSTSNSSSSPTNYNILTH
ncbi:hypothetical protein BJ944DRAFT_187382 [Cunninghamella echinulata]|nr:hypothetical protein BJ944DRAFT_187382 [Cunninghamella echinulata]